jgi:aldose sugar dehydrogenase
MNLFFSRSFPKCAVRVAAHCATSFALPLTLVSHAWAAPTQSNAVDGRAKVAEVAKGLEQPWALSFLPGDAAGRMLVTERDGNMRIVTPDGRVGAPLAGVPKVHARNQGGLLDVVAAPDFATSRTIFFTYSESSDSGARTVVARAKLSANADRLEDVRVIFGQADRFDGGHHFGSRIVFARDGTLWVGLGDRYSGKDKAQTLDSHLGKVIRINQDGSVPSDNPFAKDANGAKAKKEIWSYGHRNIQGAAMHPTTGKLWTNEHGPRGGDELNVTESGKNYGWPVIGYGVDYTFLKIHDTATKAGMEQPAHYWVPSIAPSGMAFYTASRFPQWKDSLFIGALVGQHLARLTLDGERVVREERLLVDRKERIRDVRIGPDGFVYVLTGERNGKILRVEP